MPDFLNVEDVLSHLDLKEHMLGAEFGCGSAVFTISLAKRLNKGRVYALDIQQEKLSALSGRAVLEKVNNISMVLCDLEAPKGSTLRDSYLDVVLIPNVLFQAENKHAMIEEGARVLKPGGQLLIIDWLKENAFSPKDLPAGEAGGMVKPEEIKAITQKLGLQMKKEFAVGDYHYALLFTK